MLPADPITTLAQQLRALETVPDSYIVVTPGFIILTASDAYLANTLKRREELVGRYLFDAFPDNPAAPEANAVRNWRASLELVITTGQPHQMALQHYDVLDPERPGHFVERHWLPRNTPVFDDQGQLQYIIHSSVNVTEEVKARRAMVQAQGREHEALAQAERERQRLSQLVLQAPAAMCLLQGPDFVYELVNPVYQQLLAGRELLGKPLLEAVPEFHGSAVWEHLRNVYRTGQTHQDQEVLLSFVGTDAHGPKEAYFNHTFQARYNELQQVDGVYVFAFDVTEQVKARQQVLDLNQQLTRVNADLDSFVYMASHDLRGPIANLEGLVQALQEELPDPSAPTGPLVQMMHDAVVRFQRTLGQLGEVLQLHQAADTAAPPVELATVVDDLRQDLLPALQQTGGALEVDAAACPVVAIPAKSLRSILYNLLSNALKYRHPDRPPHVRLTCRTEGGYWCLTVQDNGLGLTAAQQAELFALFRRFHDHVDGSGLGLYTVKKTAENLGGRVEVQSEPGLGSTFRVYVPSPAR
ncbi:PAS domain-containing sensor histidine kinase [Hymenobacter sp. BT175]|uniref:sensor histidine kinase n=1 Tax=Hymenobacter translucens TaxID=2886507 RepID=UPI001D0F3348|nr:PAS domain-containing sensor histidine kinase [Hymenobacter translucens]MCC2546694.1 PAS domain-containing sensor histidine kinase [Hymenobacter translucens]